MAIANVMLVDDEVGFVDTMTKRLTKRELAVTKAFGGQEALDTLEKDSSVENGDLGRQDAGNGRHRDPKAHQVEISPRGGDHAHRTRHGGNRHRGHEAGRIRLFAQTLRHRRPCSRRSPRRPPKNARTRRKSSRRESRKSSLIGHRGRQAKGRCIMSEKNETRESTQPQSIRVMLVDDEVGYLHVLANRLRKRGLSVVKCKSGGNAIRTLRKQDFDVAVLDLKMEDMDGIEVLKIFRKMDPLLMVVMLTGHGSEKAAREGDPFRRLRLFDQAVRNRRPGGQDPRSFQSQAGQGAQTR